MNMIFGRFTPKSSSVSSRSKSSSSRSSRSSRSSICSATPLFSRGEYVKVTGREISLLRRHKITPNLFIVDQVDEDRDLTGRCNVYFYDISHVNGGYTLDSVIQENLEKARV
jgi:hypothetical protein